MAVSTQNAVDQALQQLAALEKKYRASSSLHISPSGMGAIILDRPLQLGPNPPRVAVDFDDLDELPQALLDLDARAAEAFNA